MFIVVWGIDASVSWQCHVYSRSHSIYNTHIHIHKHITCRHLFLSHPPSPSLSHPFPQSNHANIAPYLNTKTQISQHLPCMPFHPRRSIISRTLGIGMNRVGIFQAFLAHIQASSCHGLGNCLCDSFGVTLCTDVSKLHAVECLCG
jgi:hypothetical protein